VLVIKARSNALWSGFTSREPARNEVRVGKAHVVGSGHHHVAMRPVSDKKTLFRGAYEIRFL